MSSESTRYYVPEFSMSTLAIYGPTYLNRTPSVCDQEDIFCKYKDVELKGYVDAIAFCRLTRKNCPIALKAQYENGNDGKKAKISAGA